MRRCTKIVIPLIASLLAYTHLASFEVLAKPPLGPKQVDCQDANPANHDSLQEEIDEADAGQTIEILGTCFQEAVITTPNLTVDGKGTGVIDGTGHTGSLIRIRSSGVTLKGLTVQNADGSGIVVGRSGSAVIQGNVIQNNGSHGIIVNQGAHALVGGNGFGHTPDEGEGNIIENNGRRGIQIRSNGSADIFHNQILNNGRDGIRLTDGGSADIDGNLIDGNSTASATSDGIHLNFLGIARLSGDGSHGEPNTITNNADYGIDCLRNSILHGDPQIFGGNGPTDNLNIRVRSNCQSTYAESP